MKSSNKLPISVALLIILVAFGLVVGNGLYTFNYAKGFAYFSDDPAACKNCHVMNQVYEGWLKGGHQHVATCNDCHVPQDFVNKWLMKAQSGFGHSYAFTFKDNPVAFTANKKSKEVIQKNCIACHQDYVANSVDPRALSISAFLDDKNVTKSHQMAHTEALNCVSCHRQVGHGHNY